MFTLVVKVQPYVHESTKRNLQEDLEVKCGPSKVVVVLGPQFPGSCCCRGLVTLPYEQAVAYFDIIVRTVMVYNRVHVDLDNCCLNMFHPSIHIST